MSQARKRRRISLAVFGFVAMSGALIQVRGTLMQSFQQTFVVSEGELGLLTPVATVGFTLAILLFGSVAGRINVKHAMVASIALTGVALAGFGLAPIFVVLLMVEGFRSFATGIFRALDRPLIGHLYPESRGRVLSLLGMGWALGAAAGPVFVTIVMAGLGFEWPVVYFALAVICVPLAIATLRLDLSVFDRNERTFALEDLFEVMGDRKVAVMAVSLMLVGGIESGFFTWLPYYVSRSLPQSIANLSLSVYLISYIPGRLAFSHLTERYRILNLLVVTTVALAATLWVTVTVVEGLLLLAGMFVVGLLMSGLFPTLIALGMEAVPSFSGPINAIGNVMARVGFFIVPALIGVLAQLYTIEVAMGVQAVLGGLLAASTLGFKFLESRGL